MTVLAWLAVHFGAARESDAAIAQLGRRVGAVGRHAPERLHGRRGHDDRYRPAGRRREGVVTRQWAETYILRVEKIGAYLARLRNSRSGWRSTGRRHNVVKWCPFAATNTPHSSGPRLTCNLVNWRAENFSTAV